MQFLHVWVSLRLLLGGVLVIHKNSLNFLLYIFSVISHTRFQQVEVLVDDDSYSPTKEMYRVIQGHVEGDWSLSIGMKQGAY